MIQIVTDFPYLGSRDYIHGTSILSGLLDALEQHGHSGITVKRLKFQRPATTNGRLLLTTQPLDPAAAEGASCIFQAVAAETLWHGLYAENGAPVTRRLSVSYPIGDVTPNAFGGSCAIAPQSRDDLVRTIVEANKRFHEAAVEPASATVRFGYLESWIVPSADIRLEGALEAKNLITKKTDDGYMTINRLTYSDRKGPGATLTLCFNVTVAVR
jgi:hypothetical protein